MVCGNALDPGVHNSPSVAADLAHSNLPADPRTSHCTEINPSVRTVYLLFAIFAGHSYVAVE